MANFTVPIIIDWKAIEEYLAQHDIVEVVRCKDCINYSKRNGYNYCYLGNGIGSENAFCSYAERRTDDNRTEH